MKFKCPPCAVLGAVTIGLLIAVAIHSSLPPQEGVLNYTQLVEQLKLNATVDEAGKAGPDDMLRGDKYMLYVNGEYVQVWEYKREETAYKDSKNIDADGSTVKLGWGSVAIYDWVAPPHFYQKGRLIVLYNGDNEEILTLLESILGEQFAGSARALL